MGKMKELYSMNDVYNSEIFVPMVETTFGEIPYGSVFYWQGVGHFTKIHPSDAKQTFIWTCDFCKELGSRYFNTINYRGHTVHFCINDRVRVFVNGRTDENQNDE